MYAIRSYYAIAGIPITIFTVIGGAFAIGIGFGAQNLFNNLISGFIIIMERPIRIGDIVEMAGEHRITSYNVCYTKLLRAFVLKRAVLSSSE